jgi:FHS family L-fucose permease-like MFS transporter
MYGFGLFLVGRICGTMVIGLTKPHRTLTIYATINVVACLLAMLGGTAGLIGLFASFFFMSIMFPTIFALGIHGLGEHTKLGSSLIVMSIVGGAIAPPFMGWLADIYSMRVGFAVPVICFALVATYGILWPRLSKSDATA